MENPNSFEEKWPEYKQKLKEEHPHLSEEDLKYDPGKEEELIHRLHEKLNKTKHEIRNWLRIMG